MNAPDASLYTGVNVTVISLKSTDELHEFAKPVLEINSKSSPFDVVLAVNPVALTSLFEVYHANVVDTAVVATAAKAAQERINLFIK